MLYVGQKIKKIREEHHYSQEQLAEKLHMSQQSYSNLERGETSITIEKLFEIADFFQLSPEELMRNEQTNIFNNSPQSGLHNTFHNNFPPELTKVYEEQITALKQVIEHQNSIISNLKS